MAHLTPSQQVAARVLVHYYQEGIPLHKVKLIKRVLYLEDGRGAREFEILAKKEEM